MSQFFFQRLREVVGEDTQVVYYRCTSDQNRNTVVAMMRAALRQIAKHSREKGQADQKGAVLNYVKQQEDQVKNSGQDHLTSRDCLWKIIQLIASDSAIGPVYVVLDGLAELDSESVEWLMRQYGELVDDISRRGSLRLKVLVVSQEVDELKSLEKQSKCGVISLDDNEKYMLSDVEQAASDRLQSIQRTPEITGETQQRT